MTKTKIQTVHFSVFQHELLRHAAATLGSGNLRQAVALPSGEDLDEWVGKSRQKRDLFFSSRKFSQICTAYSMLL